MEAVPDFVGIKVSEVAWVYILTVFLVYYATTQLDLPRVLILNAVLYAAMFELVTVPFFTSGVAGRCTSAALSYRARWHSRFSRLSTRRTRCDCRGECLLVRVKPA
jgi:hypothetical protein